MVPHTYSGSLSWTTKDLCCNCKAPHCLKMLHNFTLNSLLRARGGWKFTWVGHHREIVVFLGNKSDRSALKTSVYCTYSLNKKVEFVPSNRNIAQPAVVLNHLIYTQLQRPTNQGRCHTLWAGREPFLPTPQGRLYHHLIFWPAWPCWLIKRNMFLCGIP